MVSTVAGPFTPLPAGHQPPLSPHASPPVSAILTVSDSHLHFSMAGETEHCLIYVLAISILSLRTAGFTLLIYWVVAF